jgi:hypothetical protein
VGIDAAVTRVTAGGISAVIARVAASGISTIAAVIARDQRRPPSDVAAVGVDAAVAIIAVVVAAAVVRLKPHHRSNVISACRAW